MRAYETLIDPGRRQAYDIQWERIKHRQSTQQEAKKRQAEAAETERKRAAEEALKKEREQRASQERLRPLEHLRSSYDNDIFELNRVVRKLAADLKRLQDQDNEEIRKEKERNGWWTYLTSSVYGKAEETEEQKQQRETERLQRLASTSIKGYELKQKEARLQSLKSALQDVNSRIAAEKKRSEDEARAQVARMQEQLRKEQEARRQLEEKQKRERQAKWEAAQAILRREQAARAAKEARDAQEARQAQEARVAQERVQRAQAAREAEAARQKEWSERVAAARSSASNKKTTCRHRAFWPKLEGSHLCSHCHTVQGRFAFQCPGCMMIACASCRQSLRGERGRNDRR